MLSRRRLVSEIRIWELQSFVHGPHHLNTMTSSGKFKSGMKRCCEPTVCITVGNYH